MEDVTASIQQIIDTRNSEMEKIHKMFQAGDINEEDRSIMEACIVLEFKGAKAVVMAKISVKASAKAESKSQDGSRKRNAPDVDVSSSSNDNAGGSPHSDEPAKRSKYDVIDVSDDGAKASAPIIKGKRLLPRNWKKMRGIKEHRDKKVYVNPNGRPYKKLCRPVLGQDFFLDEKDAVAWIIQQRSAAAAVPHHPDAPPQMLVLQPLVSAPSNRVVVQDTDKQGSVAEAPDSPPVTPRASSSSSSSSSSSPATPVSCVSPQTVPESQRQTQVQVLVPVQAVPLPLRPIRKAWHSDEHSETRELVKHQVHIMIKPYFRRCTARELQYHVGYLESSLYVDADSIAAYADLSTLMHRLRVIRQADRNRDSGGQAEVVPDVKVEESVVVV